MLELNFRKRKLRLTKSPKGVWFELEPAGVKVFVKVEHLYKVKTALELQFYGTLKEKMSVEGEGSGYLVFFKGKDKWGLRLSDGKVREAVYLSRQDVLSLKNYIG